MPSSRESEPQAQWAGLELRLHVWTAGKLRAAEGKQFGGARCAAAALLHPLRVCSAGDAARNSKHFGNDILRVCAGVRRERKHTKMEGSTHCERRSLDLPVSPA